MNQNHQQNIESYKKPKRKTLKIILLTILLVILGIGIWVGVSAFTALKKITALSAGNNFLSFLGDSRQTLKGESDGRTNILLLGMGGKSHPGGMLSDTMIVLSINWKTKKLAMISIPRDLYVQIPGYGWSKINAAYSHGEQNAKTTGGGGQVSSEIVSDILDIPIHYFVSLDFEGFKKIVDTVGGIDVYVDKAISDPYYPAANMIDYNPFKISQGQHHLDGETALKYARSRETTSDFDRSERQQKVMVATKEKILTLGFLSNPKKVTDLLTILGKHIKTNLSINEIKSLFESLKDLDTQNITNKVFDTSAESPLTSTSDSRGYIILPKKGMGNYIDLQKIAKNIFNSANTGDFTIEVLNGSGKSGQATKAADTLEEKSYKVAKIDDAEKTYENSIVYNCAGVKADTIVKDIADILNAQQDTKTTCNNYDILVIVGQSAL